MPRDEVVANFQVQEVFFSSVALILLLLYHYRTHNTFSEQEHSLNHIFHTPNHSQSVDLTPPTPSTCLTLAAKILPTVSSPRRSLGPRPAADRFLTEAQEKLTPDSQKSTLDKATESVTNAGDSIAGAVQPGRHPSTMFFHYDVLTLGR
jgi:hypothetical protein